MKRKARVSPRELSVDPNNFLREEPVAKFDQGRNHTAHVQEKKSKGLPRFLFSCQNDIGDLN